MRAVKVAVAVVHSGEVVFAERYGVTEWARTVPSPLQPCFRSPRFLPA